LRIAVIGAGALGCLFGSRLDVAGNNVLLIHHRKSVADSIEEKGVSVRELSGKVVHTRIEIRTRLSRQDKPDLVLVTVKAYDTARVASLLKKSVKGDVPVLSLQNGLGNVDALQRDLGTGSIIPGATTEGALTTGPGGVSHTGSGLTWLGETNGKISGRCLAIRRVFRSAGFRAVVSNNIKGVLWAKAIVNSAINPVSAITCLRNGDLYKTPELREIEFSIIDEGSAVARANGILLQPSPKLLLAKVLKSTRGNKSSMLQDILAGRRTEIGQLNGSISHLGRLVGVNTPLNDALTKLVHFLERSQGKL
jgi:2-dehydropantoate 2-reductase